jgi:hypothetical protein
MEKETQKRIDIEKMKRSELLELVKIQRDFIERISKESDRAVKTINVLDEENQKLISISNTIGEIRAKIENGFNARIILSGGIIRCIYTDSPKICI